MRLEQDQHRLAVKGKAFVFPHILTNTGNVTSRYQLRVPDNGGISDIRLFHDRSHSGQVNPEDEIKGLVALAAGESMAILVSGTAPSATTSLTLRTDVSGHNRCQPGSTERFRCFDENRDDLVLGQHTVYHLNKQMNPTVASAGERVEVDFLYERLDQKADKSRLVTIDVLPEVMMFDRANKVLSCDGQGEHCIELKSPIAKSDNGYEVRTVTVDDIARQEIKIQLTGQPAGKKGTIKFSTTIKSGFAARMFFNQAEYYSHNEKEKQLSNRVPVRIEGSGVTVNGSAFSSAKALGEPVIVPNGDSGSTVEFTNYVWNTGTKTTSYNVYPDRQQGANTFPPGSQYSLCDDENDSSCTPFEDDLQFVEVFVSELVPTKKQAIRLRVKLPATIKPEHICKDGYRIRLKAEAEGNGAVYDHALNLLGHINDGRVGVDLTFGQSLKENANAPGIGPGPESSPLKVITVKPGDRALFDKVFVNNTGKKPDSYNLRVVAPSGAALPEGLKIQFLNLHDRPVSNTGVIRGDEAVPVKLAIDLPDKVQHGQYSIHVEARSPVTGQQDKLHLALNIGTSEGLALEPDGNSPVAPGSFVTFSHRLTNTGSEAISGIRLLLSDDQNWQPQVYRDKNGDGQIADGEPPIDGVVSVPAGEVLHLVVKVFAPANAALGIRETIVLKALWHNRAGQEQTLRVQDIATVDNTHVTIIKEQAPWDCQGALPIRFSKDTFPAKPGTCVVYRLTASNLGSEPIQQVVIHDAAPNFTVFCEQSGLPKTEGRVPGQIHTSGQAIRASWSKGLAPGETVVLFFGVRIQ